MAEAPQRSESQPRGAGVKTSQRKPEALDTSAGTLERRGQPQRPHQRLVIQVARYFSVDAEVAPQHIAAPSTQRLVGAQAAGTAQTDVEQRARAGDPVIQADPVPAAPGRTDHQL